MDSSTPQLYALTFLAGLTHSEVNNLLSFWRNAGHSIDELFQLPASKLTAADLTEAQVQAALRAREQLDVAAKALKPCELARVQVIAADDPLYPVSLDNSLHGANPPILFAAGNLELLSEPRVAMIGSREALEISLDFTRAVAAGFAAEGRIVVSGYAEGVDRAASEAILQANGATIIVLAQGLLTFSTGRGRLSEWLAQGRLLALSQFPPRSDWKTPHAMARNAVIAGMVDDIIVSQAGLSGGTWETARIALRQGKHVWIRQDEDPNLGHVTLQKLGARAVEWPSDDSSWMQEIIDRRPTDEAAAPVEEWTEARVMEILRHGTASEIHESSGLTGQILIRLLESRGTVALNTLNDLRKIKGFGPGSIREVALAFGLPVPADETSQLSLFPSVEEFRNWQSKDQTKQESPPSAKSEDNRDDLFSSEPQMPSPRAEPSESPSAAGGGEGRREGTARPRRKNILLLMASHQRADSLGCYGQRAFDTPHIDRLAAGGALLTRAYTTGSMEMPARASLLTGMAYRTHGLWTDGIKLPENVPTLATHLAAQDYVTAFVGKMHLAPFSAPEDVRSRESRSWWDSRSMDKWAGPYYGFHQVRLIMGDGLTHGHYSRWLLEHHPAAARFLRSAEFPLFFPLTVDPELHSSTWIAEHAVRFLHEFADTPFFLACSFAAPPPFAPLAEDLQSCRVEHLPQPVGSADDLTHMPAAYQRMREGGADGSLHRQILDLSPELQADLRKHYYAMALAVDAAVGKILETLDELKLSEDTLVVYTSDMGECLGDHGIYGAGPFAYENLIRVPYIWRLPGVVPGGTTIDGMASHLDFLPTACALVGAEVPDAAQGIALDRCLEGRVSSPRKAALVEHSSPVSRELGVKTIVTAAHKASLGAEPDEGVMFDLSADPSEKRNLENDPALKEVRGHLLEQLLHELGQTEIRTPLPSCEG